MVRRGASAGGTPEPRANSRSCRPSNSAVRRRWGGMHCAAMPATTWRSATTPAATGTARSVRRKAAQRWLEARQADLLPVEYYHVVFTLPEPISAIAYTNKAVIYRLLFDVAAETLTTIAADPKHLGAADRRHPGAAHLGFGADASSPRAWHRARRRTVAGRRALGRLPARFLPAGTGAVAAVPAALPRGTGEAASRRPVAVLRRARRPGRCQGLRPVAGAAARQRVGGLCQASVRRSRGGAGLPVALYPPGGHLEPAAGRHG